jgi:lysine-ketoglutarate reductase/saccharopine dehydrogenase-like protein (TIGR00300 family)
MRILVCPPEHFGVDYVINPWMEGQLGRVDRPLARAQWNDLVEAIAHHAEVEQVEPVAGSPDMCFTANAGLTARGRVVPARFRHPERATEEAPFAAWFERAGFELVALPVEDPFEGEGDALFQPGEPLVWAGYGVRSALETHASLGPTFGVEVVSLRLVDPRFYHLDTCFAPLPQGRLLYHPPAFDERSRRAIERRIPRARRIAVDDRDATGFACNVLRLGDRLLLNQASESLRSALAKWGYEVQECPVSEFMKAGGGVKCLSLILDQPDFERLEPAPPSPIRATQVELRGHLLDTGGLNRALDVVADSGGSFRLHTLALAERKDQESRAVLRIVAPSPERLEGVVAQLMSVGGRPLEHEGLARLETVTRAGVAPDSFYSTTIYPTEIHLADGWCEVEAQRMDAVIVVGGDDAPAGTGDAATATGAGAPRARCKLFRDLRAGERVVCGVEGVRVRHPEDAALDEFSFMNAPVSSERHVESTVKAIAWEMRRIRERGGRIVVVAGPVVVHTGGARHLARLVETGFVQALLTGNALPVHDIEHDLFGTSLGVDLAHGRPVREGHRNHLMAINRVRAAGGIREAVEAGIVQSGVMYACVRHAVPFVLAGSIRDDGPLPDTMMDLEAAQAAYAKAIEGADMILMLSSMLHAIGTGNMTPAGVRLICVDISPAVVTKLADRGSLESTGIVTDVGLFLNLLAANLAATAD